jgi:hypothetical protein
LLALAIQSARAEDTAPDSTSKSLLRVNSTNQVYEFFQPWIKKPPFSRRGIGALIDGDRILVTAELVANSTFIELEKPATAEKSTATVERVDLTELTCSIAMAGGMPRISSTAGLSIRSKNWRV